MLKLQRFKRFVIFWKNSLAAATKIIGFNDQGISSKFEILQVITINNSTDER